MLRRLCLVLLAAAAIASVSVDLSACGDKFLRVGRSARFRRYASVHPSAILVYAARWKQPGISDFETMLRRAGHKPVTVMSEGALREALMAARYQVVITSYADAGATREVIQAASSAAAVLPVVYRATKNEENAAAAAYRHLLVPGKMTPFDALEQLDRVIEVQLRNDRQAQAR